MFATVLSLASLACLTLTLVSGGCPSGYEACVDVKNSCSSPLYIHRTSIDETNSYPTQVTTIASGDTSTVDLTGWKDLSGQRLYAWFQNPLDSVISSVQYADKVEINWCNTNPDTMCYNPTAVDYFALPVHIGPYNSTECPTVPLTGCAKNVSVIESECPTRWTTYGHYGVCQAPSHACSDDNTLDICNAFDTVIATCVSDGNCGTATTTEVYGCSGSFATEPQWCAAIIRGMYDTVANGSNQNDPDLFYQTDPYSVYSAWLHSDERCQKFYTFPYDDYQGDGASGYQVCETNHLWVEWCPVVEDNTTQVTTTSTMTPTSNTPGPTSDSDAFSVRYALVYSVFTFFYFISSC